MHRRGGQRQDDQGPRRLHPRPQERQGRHVHVHAGLPRSHQRRPRQEDVRVRAAVRRYWRSSGDG